MKELAVLIILLAFSVLIIGCTSYDKKNINEECIDLINSFDMGAEEGSIIGKITNISFKGSGGMLYGSSRTTVTVEGFERQADISFSDSVVTKEPKYWVASKEEADKIINERIKEKEKEGCNCLIKESVTRLVDSSCSCSDGYTYNLGFYKVFTYPSDRTYQSLESARVTFNVNQPLIGKYVKFDWLNGKFIPVKIVDCKKEE